MYIEYMQSHRGLCFILLSMRLINPLLFRSQSVTNLVSNIVMSLLIIKIAGFRGGGRGGGRGGFGNRYQDQGPPETVKGKGKVS